MADQTAISDKYKSLYHAVNDMMAKLGASGNITTRADEVSQVMDALHDIDGGVYKQDINENQAMTEQTAGQNIMKLSSSEQGKRHPKETRPLVRGKRYLARMHSDDEFEAGTIEDTEYCKGSFMFIPDQTPNFKIQSTYFHEIKEWPHGH